MQGQKKTTHGIRHHFLLMYLFRQMISQLHSWQAERITELLLLYWPALSFTPITVCWGEGWLVHPGSIVCWLVKIKKGGANLEGHHGSGRRVWLPRGPFVNKHTCIQNYFSWIVQGCCEALETFSLSFVKAGKRSSSQCCKAGKGKAGGWNYCEVQPSVRRGGKVLSVARCWKSSVRASLFPCISSLSSFVCSSF